MNQTVELLNQAREYLLAAKLSLAENLLRQIIARDPGESCAYELLGKLLYRDSRNEEAASVYREWLRASPANPVAAHLVSATSGQDQPERASDGFIAEVFSRAAAEFDTGLEKLSYQAPRLIFEQTMAALDPTRVGLDILDLGCGTGLCGEWLRPLARRMVGVDLSPEMLERARARGCYDELICGEITAYTTHCTDCFDVITAADVFCYFGELGTVLSAAARLLCSGGTIVFSVEELPAGRASYELLEHGRYAHSASYLGNIWTGIGIAPVCISRAMLRFERGTPVHGLVAAVR